MFDMHPVKYLLVLLAITAVMCKQIPAHTHDRIHTLRAELSDHLEHAQLHKEHTPRNLQSVTRAAMRLTFNTSSFGTVVAPTTAATLSFLTNVMLVIKQFVKLRFQVYS